MTYVGLQYTYVAAIPGIGFSLLLYFQLRGRRTVKAGGVSTASIWAAMKAQRRALLLLSGLILFRSTAIQSIATFLAIYLTGRGSSLMYAGFALGAYELAGAFGALTGGTLSDRFGRKTMMLVSQAIAGPLLLLALWLPDGPLSIAALAMAGALALSASPVQLTLAQELLPRRAEHRLGHRLLPRLRGHPRFRAGGGCGRRHLRPGNRPRRCRRRFHALHSLHHGPARDLPARLSLVL